jgi:hypothetical protein
MASPVSAYLVLCDAAQADPSGKIHMLGAGWSITTPNTPHAVAVLMKVPWDRSNEPIHLQLDLTDSDLKPVAFETPTGPLHIHGDATMEVGRPPGIVHGSDLDASFAMNIQALPLRPGRYVWCLKVGDELIAQAPFNVRAG